MVTRQKPKKADRNARRQRPATKKGQSKKASSKKVAEKKASSKKVAEKKVGRKSGLDKHTAGKSSRGLADSPPQLAFISDRKAAPKPDHIEVDPDVLEFIDAIDKYKHAHQRPFPTWSEILHILRDLGYRR